MVYARMKKLFDRQFWIYTLEYSLVYLWIVLPVAALVVSALLASNHHLGKWKWFVPLTFGVMHMLAEYATFSTANMIQIEFSRINPPAFDLLLMGAVISIVGLGFGSLVRRIKGRR